MVYLAILILTVLHLYGTSATPLQTVNGTISIQIGTTAGCPDAVRFMTQVVPTFAKYKNFLNIEFVPWGRARRNDDGSLTCQFGEPGCWANRVHRCVLSLLSGNYEAKVQYMSCEFTEPFPAFRQRSLSCARSVGVNLVDVDYCISTTGDALEGRAEEISRAAVATINFIPFIIFNNNIDVNQHRQAYQRFESTICFALADDPSTGITHCRL